MSNAREIYPKLQLEIGISRWGLPYIVLEDGEAGLMASNNSILQSSEYDYLECLDAFVEDLREFIRPRLRKLWIQHKGQGE